METKVQSGKYTLKQQCDFFHLNYKPNPKKSHILNYLVFEIYEKLLEHELNIGHICKMKLTEIQ